MKRIALTLLSTSMLGATGLAAAADIGVMTQNQYVGTDLIGLVASPDFNSAVVDALRTRAASLPTERAGALAALIDRRGPALVGLQEVYRFTCYEQVPAPDDGKGCDDQSIAGAFTDQLDDTLSALGGRYVAAAHVVNLDLPSDLELPPPLDALPGIPVIMPDGTVILVGVVDRDVILARTDVAFDVIDFTQLQAYAPGVCAFESADGCKYQVVASADITLPIPFPPYALTRTVRFERGFVGVDATVGGVPYRFINTHLETRLESFGPLGRYYQTAQATELYGTLQVLEAVNPRGRTLVVGDFNSDARDVEEVPGLTPPYQIFAGEQGAFTDVWTLRPGAATGRGAPLVGMSCCQDEDLGNHRSTLYERVDLIFSLAVPGKVLNARLLGESVADKTWPPGLGVWPSDHASVAARLRY
jgi:endonuclease/exonuclease/phosphatase family metal-dependent hydrolase